MHCYTITITTQEKLTPGSLDHLLAIAANPNNKRAVEVIEQDV